MESDRDYGQNTFGFLENADLNTASSKTCMTYSETALEGLCETWPKSGMIRLGRSSTRSLQEFPKDGAEFTFWESVMESPTEPIYSIATDELESKERSTISKNVAERKLKKLKRMESDSMLFNALMNTKNRG